MIRMVLGLALLLCTYASGLHAQQGTVVFNGVAVIPMDRDEVLQNQTVIVENRRISYVGAARNAPAGATVVDGRGKFLIPGLAESWKVMFL